MLDQRSTNYFMDTILPWATQLFPCTLLECTRITCVTVQCRHLYPRYMRVIGVMSMLGCAYVLNTCDVLAPILVRQGSTHRKVFPSSPAHSYACYYTCIFIYTWRPCASNGSATFLVYYYVAILVYTDLFLACITLTVFCVEVTFICVKTVVTWLSYTQDVDSNS